MTGRRFYDPERIARTVQGSRRIDPIGKAIVGAIALFWLALLGWLIFGR